MTVEELKWKHEEISIDRYYRSHCKISIQFAISVLEETLNSESHWNIYYLIEYKIKELKEQLK